MDRVIVQHTSCSPIETRALGVSFGSKLLPNSVVCLFGDLGAGKTTFIKGVAAGIQAASEEEVNSPTFTYLSVYHGVSTLYHFDLYRLRDADEFLNMGFDDVFYSGGICCIEWSEKIQGLLPSDAVHVRISHQNEETRFIEIAYPGI